jgi:hypothetical protein
MRPRNLRSPNPGKQTYPYISLRSTQPYAEWLYQLASVTHRTAQQIIEDSIAEYSRRHSDPCGSPPSRLVVEDNQSVNTL